MCTGVSLVSMCACVGGCACTYMCAWEWREGVCVRVSVLVCRCIYVCVQYVNVCVCARVGTRGRMLCVQGWHLSFTQVLPIG